MNISDLKARQGNVEVIGEITEVGEVREFQKFGKSGRVASAKLKDETGEVKLSLWNEQIDDFKVGDKIKIENGYVNEWQGELQLTTGKFGKMEKIEIDAEQKKSLTETVGVTPEGVKTDKGSHILSDDETVEEEALNNELGKPQIQDSVTHDEKVESESLENLNKPTESPSEEQTSDEVVEEEIKVEEEEVK